MPSPIIPVVKSVYICDEVIRDPASGKVSLLSLWDTVRLPAGATFPYVLGKLCVFAWLRDGRGQVRCRIMITQAPTEAAIFQTNDFLLDFTNRATQFASFRLNHVRFPGPGYYYVELYCENQFVDDQAVQILTA